jgi:hypothetical protein
VKESRCEIGMTKTDVDRTEGHFQILIFFKGNIGFLSGMQGDKRQSVKIQQFMYFKVEICYI